MDVHRIDFTIEPFVEGQPGEHVTGAAAALAELGVVVEVGPFGSSCTVASDAVASVSETLLRRALELGATHINIAVEPAS